jgi:hypothetical protein
MFMARMEVTRHPARCQSHLPQGQAQQLLQPQLQPVGRKSSRLLAAGYSRVAGPKQPMAELWLAPPMLLIL